MKTHLVILAILETLDECAGEAAEGWVYTALNSQGVDIHQYNALRDAMCAAELVACNAHVMSITEKGRKVVAECAAAKNNAIQ